MTLEQLTQAWVYLAVFMVAPIPGHSSPLKKSPKDRGVFNDLNEQVILAIPPWLKKENQHLYIQEKQKRIVATIDNIPIAVFTLLTDEMKPSMALIFENLPTSIGGPNFPDQDGDGIPDGVDVMRGARKAALNGAKYLGGYERLAYPGGDVSRTKGVCTDVVIRALRNAGFDLQSMIYQDMRRAPRAYGLKPGHRPDRHIEHRRVRRQIVYFRRHFRSLPPQFQPEISGPMAYRPGDIVFMDTLPKQGPDHVGIVSDRVDSRGQPLIINNWDDGYKTQDMALLNSIPITHRFRISEPK